VEWSSWTTQKAQVSYISLDDRANSIYRRYEGFYFYARIGSGYVGEDEKEWVNDVGEVKLRGNGTGAEVIIPSLV
jgi:hypothetical protein